MRFEINLTSQEVNKIRDTIERQRLNGPDTWVLTVTNDEIIFGKEKLPRDIIRQSENR